MQKEGYIMSRKTFIWALDKMHSGVNVGRKEWKGGNTVSVYSDIEQQLFFMIMKGGITIPWSPTNVDIFASDWEEAGS